MNLEAARAQLNNCCRKTPAPSQPVLTGIAKHKLELDETTAFWLDLASWSSNEEDSNDGRG